MQIFRFDDLPTHTIAQFGSLHAAIGGVARGNAPFQIGYLRLDPGGVLGMHPALSGQLLLILSGEGWVSGDDGFRRAVCQGLAVYWQTGDMHETDTDTGLTALVLEADDFEVPALTANGSPNPP
jgi:quercetin dioxygenase-like cupin family protein